MHVSFFGHGGKILFFILYLTDFTDALLYTMPYYTESENKGDLIGVGVAVREKKY